MNMAMNRDDVELAGGLHSSTRPDFVMRHPWCVYVGDRFIARFGSVECAARTAQNTPGRPHVVNDQTGRVVPFEECVRIVSQMTRGVDQDGNPRPRW